MVLPKLPYCRVMSRLYETGVISCVRHTDNSSPYEAVDRHFCNFFPPCDRDLRIVSDSDMADCSGGPPPVPLPLPVAAVTTDAMEPSRPPPVRLPSVRRIGLPVAAALLLDAAAEADDPLVEAAAAAAAAVVADPPPMLLRS